MSKSRISVKISSVILAVAMLVTMLAIGASAYTAPDEMTFVSNDTTALAPGVTEDKYVTYNRDGEQLVYYSVKADVNSDTVAVKSNYQNNDNTGNWGKQTVADQVAAAESKRGYNVVASTNGSFYDVSSGRPTGAFVMEGVDLNGTTSGNSMAFFAVLKDGSAVIDKQGTYTNYAENVQEALGGSRILVWDSAVPTGLSDSGRRPRTSVGITADGQVILSVIDGDQSPYSAGATTYEQAIIMQSLGCVTALEVDGGGSTTYGAKVEGSDSFAIRNSPSDGTARAVSNSIMVVSSAAKDGVFDHAVLSADSSYYTPNSQVTFSAKGIDAGGGAATIPETGITWALSDASFGTIENGVFTSTGKTGTVEAQMLYNGNVVGSETVNIVNPTKLEFSQDTATVPYGKTSDLEITGYYGESEVTMKATDLNWSLSDAALGTISNGSFTATTDETVTTGVATATLAADSSITDTIDITLGKGSEVVLDFEDGDSSNWVVTGAGENEKGSAYAATAKTGQVKNGNYSLAIHSDFTQTEAFNEWSSIRVSYNGSRIYRTGARTLGMWVYIPEDAAGSQLRLRTWGSADGTTYANKSYWLNTISQTDNISEAGWHYYTYDISGFKSTAFPGNYGAENWAFEIYVCPSSTSDSRYTSSTLYIDDITFDYSSVVDDREAPVISNAVTINNDTEATAAIAGQTITNSLVTVTADVADDKTKTNFTGLDYSTAKIYIDGKDCSKESFFTASAGKISAAAINLADGTHSIAFEIADKAGNVAKTTKYITVASGSSLPTVSVEPADPDAKDLLCGSVYKLNVETDKIEDIKSVTTVVKIENMHSWELDHITYANGFTGSYSLDETTNTATITITRTGENTQTGSAVLAVLPTRVWSLITHDGGGAYIKTTVSVTPYYQWYTRSAISKMDYKYSVKYGSVTYTSNVATPSNYVAGFASANKSVTTELNDTLQNLKAKNYYWHEHDATLVTKNAKEATCTEEGYTGDKYCETCGSIVEYGEVIPAKGHVSAGAATCTEPEVCSVCGEEISPALGHSWTYADGVFTCTRCGETCTDCTGFVDGKYYSSGKLAQGWVTDSGNKYYFVDGVAKTGANMIENVVYVFDDNGVYTAATYSVKFYSDETGLYYIVNNKPVTGWKSINGADYYFSPETYAATTGTAKIGDFTYKFDANGKLTEGQWVTLKDGTKKYMYAGKYVSYSFIEINGKTYWFDNKGYMAKGTQLLQISLGGPLTMYVIGDDGVVEGKLNYTGIYELNGKKYYVIDGVAQHGLYEIDGGVYYFNSSYIMKTGKYYSSYTLTGSDGYNYVKGNYYFDSETGKMLNKVISEIDGVKYYFEHGNPVSAGLVTVNGTKYIAGSAGKILTSDKDFGTWVDGTYYYVHADGTVIENGFVTVDGVKYYLKNGKITKTGLTVIDGATYYISTNSGRVITDQGYWVSADKSGTGKDEYYYFDEDGKMRNNEFLTVNGSIYYIVNGQPAKLGLAEIDGALYYLSTNSGKAETGKYYVSATNGLGEAGYYYFGEDGKALDKVFYEENGKKYYIENGKIAKSGLVKVDGKYYYLSTNSGAAATGVHYVEAKNANGLMAAGYYTFGTDGAMIIG